MLWPPIGFQICLLVAASHAYVRHINKPNFFCKFNRGLSFASFLGFPGGFEGTDLLAADFCGFVGINGRFEASEEVVVVIHLFVEEDRATDRVFNVAPTHHI